MTIRAFVAVDPSEAVRQWLADVRAELEAACARERIKASFPGVENLHVTLKFLGDVHGERLDAIVEALRQAARRDPFEIAFGGLGAFPSVRKPTVLWVGIQTGEAALKTLAEQVDRCFSKLGFSPEAREFRAHLTLARVKKAPSGAARVVHPVSPGETPSSPVCLVNELTLYKSELGPKGSRYTPLASAPLAP